jgi:hypothetical protein
MLTKLFQIAEMINAPVSFDFKEKLLIFWKQSLRTKIYFDCGNFGYDLASMPVLCGNR